jgi:hypothetical protein
MFEPFFGLEMPLLLQFVLDFLGLLGLIVVTSWAVGRSRHPDRDQ